MTESVLPRSSTFIALSDITGTTWTQEMVWNIVHDLDLDTAKKVSLDKRVPFLEFSSLCEEVYQLYSSNIYLKLCFNEYESSSKIS